MANREGSLFRQPRRTPIRDAIDARRPGEQFPNRATPVRDFIDRLFGFDGGQGEAEAGPTMVNAGPTDPNKGNQGRGGGGGGGNPPGDAPLPRSNPAQVVGYTEFPAEEDPSGANWGLLGGIAGGGAIGYMLYRMARSRGLSHQQATAVAQNAQTNMHTYGGLTPSPLTMVDNRIDDPADFGLPATQTAPVNRGYDYDLGPEDYDLIDPQGRVASDFNGQQVIPNMQYDLPPWPFIVPGAHAEDSFPMTHFVPQTYGGQGTAQFSPQDYSVNYDARTGRYVPRGNKINPYEYFNPAMFLR